MLASLSPSREPCFKSKHFVHVPGYQDTNRDEEDPCVHSYPDIAFAVAHYEYSARTGDNKDHRKDEV
jgi:hypothetical protein